MMKTLQSKTEIKEIYSAVRELSFEEKKSPLIAEAKVNEFLDAILSFKEKLKLRTDELDKINESIEKVTWFQDITNEDLKLINDLISAAKDLHSSLIRQYVVMTSIKAKGIAKKEIKDYKNILDDLRELTEDLESVFFHLPEMPDFQETTKQLSLI